MLYFCKSVKKLLHRAKPSLGLALACVLGVSSFVAMPAYAFKPLTEEQVQARIDAFDKIDVLFKALRFKVVNQKSTDSLGALELSAPLVEEALKLEELFDAPSARNDFPFSRARPEIWQRSAHFNLLLDRFLNNLEEIHALIQAKNLKEAAPLIDTVAKSCRQCHNGYRYR